MYTLINDTLWRQSILDHSRYLLSEHILRDLLWGGRDLATLKAVFARGRIIEEHRSDHRRPVFLICGILKGHPTHLLISLRPDHHVVMVASYTPQMPLWRTPNQRAVGVDEMDTEVNCFFCNAPTQEIVVGNFDYRIENVLHVVKNVPARLCQQCGEKYVAPAVAERISTLISGARPQTQEAIQVFDYTAAP